MKKVAFVLMFVMSVAGSAFAETTKDAARKVGSFWDREAERSGLKESTSSWGQFWTNMNPGKYFKDQQEAYNARKAGAVAK